MRSYLLVALIALTFIQDCGCGNSGMIDKIKSGFKLAGKLLGWDYASEVAELVSESFGKSKKGDNSGDNLFSGFLRIFGFDTKKIGAITVNAIVFLAQLISTTLSKPPPSELTEARTLQKGTPFDWIMKDAKLEDLIKMSKEENLPDHINEYIKERTSDEDTGCIQLLICKSAPFIKGMQTALKSKEEAKKKGKGALFEFIPKLEEVERYSDECEQKYPDCAIEY